MKYFIRNSGRDIRVVYSKRAVDLSNFYLQSHASFYSGLMGLHDGWKEV